MMQSPDSKTRPFRSGFVALVGRPNVGKSTLLNACYGGKIAITSPVAQTTRRRMRAVVNTPGSQLVIVDTPGLHKPKDALGKELNKAALGELADVDVVALLIDATMPVGRGDEWVAKHVAASRAPFKLLVVTKADKATSEQVGAQLDAARALAPFDDALVVSAREGFNVDSFLSLVSQHLPEGPRWFPEDMDVDMEDEELVAEFIREKVLLNLRQEVPHSVGVICDDVEWAKDGHASISATIVVEREGQKGIVIGHKGAMIKKIGMEARRDVERLLDAPCFLDLQVRVRPLWRRDQNEIRRMGLEAEG
ncbi:GTPase Era [Olsenella urininfantis]|uniref:GTPase Era n=1 Tax=Olsenella urininfantis TaxID=1871033 RepID=UPI000BE83A2D|nr:GTPase Era [Olsenella urininfantis]